MMKKSGWGVLFELSKLRGKKQVFEKDLKVGEIYDVWLRNISGRGPYKLLRKYGTEDGEGEWLIECISSRNQSVIRKGEEPVYFEPLYFEPAVLDENSVGKVFMSETGCFSKIKSCFYDAHGFLVFVWMPYGGKDEQRFRNWTVTIVNRKGQDAWSNDYLLQEVLEVGEDSKIDEAYNNIRKASTIKTKEEEEIEFKRKEEKRERGRRFYQAICAGGASMEKNATEELQTKPKLKVNIMSKNEMNLEMLDNVEKVVKYQEEEIKRTGVEPAYHKLGLELINRQVSEDFFKEIKEGRLTYDEVIKRMKSVGREFEYTREECDNIM